MSDVEVREREDLAISAIGEIVDLADAKACALALDRVRDLERQLGSVKTILTRAIVTEAERLGSMTIELDGRVQAEVRSGDRLTYDPDKLIDLLSQAGMPEDRINEIVREEVTLTVVAKELKKAARANPAYAEILEATKTVEHGAPSVVIRRR